GVVTALAVNTVASIQISASGPASGTADGNWPVSYEFYIGGILTPGVPAWNLVFRFANNSSIFLKQFSGEGHAEFQGAGVITCRWGLRLLRGQLFSTSTGYPSTLGIS